MPMVIPFLAAGGAAAAGAAGGAATVGGVAGLLGVTSVTTAAVVNAAVGTAIALGASYAAAKLTPGPKAPRPSDGSIEFKQPTPARFFTYGHVKISGPVLFLEMSDEGTAAGQRLLKIVAFGTRELAVFDAFYVDGKASPVLAGADGSDALILAWHQDGSDRGGAWLYRGTDGQAAAFPLLSYFAAWTADHRLAGIPYSASQFESPPNAETFQSAFPNGESNLAAVGGVKVYDPRRDPSMGAYYSGSGAQSQTDPTTWEFNDNQRLCCLDWITWKDGYNKAWSRIDWSSWVPQIAMADELVPLKAGGTEKRYRVATRVSYDEPRSRVLHRLMQAGDQQLFVTANGLIGSRGGVWQEPTVDLAIERMPEAVMTHGVPMMDRINEFQLTAMLPERDYAEFELEPWQATSDPDFVAGIVRRAPLELTQVPSNAQAQRLAKIYMAKQNPAWTGSVRTGFAGLDAVGEAAVNLSFDELAIDGPYWINGKVAFLPDRTGVTFPVASADPASYSWNAATEEKPTPPAPA